MNTNFPENLPEIIGLVVAYQFSVFDWQTPVEDVPLAIAPFQGRVLIGVGKLLRIYDLGKKKLLRKCENKVRGDGAAEELDVLFHL